MRKMIGLIIGVALCLTIFSDCKDTNGLNLSKNDIVSITINTLPASETSCRTYTSIKKISAVVDYLNELHLVDEFSENPNEYAGMTYIITINYAAGVQEKFSHFGNMFFGQQNGDELEWKRMEYNEASKFETLIQDNLSD